MPGARLEYMFVPAPGVAVTLRDRAILGFYTGFRLAPGNSTLELVQGLRLASHAGGSMVALVDCVAPPRGRLLDHMPSCKVRLVIEKVRRGAGRGKLSLERVLESLANALADLGSSGPLQGELVFYTGEGIIPARDALVLAERPGLSLVDRLIAALVAGSERLGEPRRSLAEAVLAVRDVSVYEILFSKGNPLTKNIWEKLRSYLDAYATEQARIIPGRWLHIEIDKLSESYQRGRSIVVRPQGPPEPGYITLIERGALEEYLEAERRLVSLRVRLETRRPGPAPP